MTTFPKFRSTAGGAVVETEVGPAPDGATVILLVEDEPSVRGLFATSLLRHGYCVLEARNGAEGLEAAERAGRLDLVVSDVVMPVMKGPQLCEKLRETRPDLRVLFVSGYLVDEQLGPNAEIMQKPFRPDQLIRKIKDLIGPAKVPQAAAS
jgi:two-component system cell cycle sensor histidine kinase/response regulator CckA